MVEWLNRLMGPGRWLPRIQNQLKIEYQKGEICLKMNLKKAKFVKKKFISKERNLLKIECQKGENGCNLNF